jgi:hypothetical protein
MNAHNGLVFGLVGALCLGAFLALGLGRLQRSFVAKLANRRGKRGEAHAERVLEKRGYQILGRQAASSYTLQVDGQRVSTNVRADLIVMRAGRTMVAEVKTGPKVARVENEGTRRQLLEYQLAFGLDGVLLVDGDSGDIREVRFPLPQKGAGLLSRLGWLIFAAAAGALVALLWMKGR